MDPVTGFTLATAVMTAIDFSIKTAKGAHYIVKSATGTSAEAARLEEPAESIVAFCEKMEKVIENRRTSNAITTSPSFPVGTTAALIASNVKCKETARQMVKQLQHLKIDKKKPSFVRKS